MVCIEWRLQDPASLLPLDEQSVRILHRGNAVVVWLIPCRETYCSPFAYRQRSLSQMFLSEMRIFVWTVRAVIFLRKDEQSCRTRISLQPPTLNFKSEGRQLKNQPANWRLLVPSSLLRGDMTSILSFSGGT